jgi:hypothetical protein
MLHMEITDFCFKIRIKHTNAPCRTQNLLIANLVVHTLTIALHGVKHYIIKIYWRVEIQLDTFSTSALDRSRQLYTLVTLPLGGQPDSDGLQSRRNVMARVNLSCLCRDSKSCLPFVEDIA